MNGPMIFETQQPFPGAMAFETGMGESEEEFGRGRGGAPRSSRGFGAGSGRSASGAGSRGGGFGARSGTGQPRGFGARSGAGQRNGFGARTGPGAPGIGSGGLAWPGGPGRPRPPYAGPWRRGVRWPLPNAVGVPAWAGDGEPTDPKRVLFIQQCLNRVMRSRLRLTGKMNAATRSLVRGFQRRSRLPLTGLVDEDTEAALRAACGGRAVAGAPAISGPQEPPVSGEPDSAASAPAAAAQEPAAGEPPIDDPGAEEPPGDALPGGEGEAEFGDFFNRIGQRARQAWDGVTDAIGSGADSRIIDLTAQADKTLRKGTRDPKKVHALVLHQMACCFKPKDPLKRFLNLNAHFAILSDGRILQLHPISAMLWSSNGFNAGSVAVEFAGNFPNTAGKWWEGAKFGRDRATPAQLDAGRYLIGYLKRTMGLTHVLAHRQSSGTRENDPGPDVWYNVGQWAIENVGMKDGGPGFKVGTGNPILDSWRNWGRSGVSRETLKEEAAGLDRRHDVELGEAGGSHTDAVRPVQRALNQLLGLRLSEDGMETPETRSAIRLFEQRRGFPITGRVTPAIVRALKQAMGRESGQGEQEFQWESESALESETATERVVNNLPAALGMTWQSLE
jgi:peptidoglycan hydrolase-like protein with peptidoglycan-binding domain